MTRSHIAKLFAGALLTATAMTSSIVLGGTPVSDFASGADNLPLQSAAREEIFPPVAPEVDPGTVVDTPVTPGTPETPPTTETPLTPTPVGDTGSINDGDSPDDLARYQVKDHLRTGLPIPASTAHLPNGNFRAICEFSHFAYEDPIIAPGLPGASHLHMFFGNTSTDAYSTYESLRTTGDSTCQGGPLNRSAYWAPAVIDTAGRAVTPDFISVYYKGRGWGTDGSAVDVVNMPPGLRMIAGAVPGDLDAPSNHEWNCSNRRVHSKTIPNCDPGQRVGVLLHFATCWDGRLDSPDHRSHVVYPVEHEVTGQPVCPTSHPQSLPEFTLGIWFSHDGDSADWHLASDRMPSHTPHGNGASFHSDWFGAWDQDVQKTWIDNCINGELDCSWGDLGNGTALSINPDYNGPNRVEPPPLPAVQARSALAQASESGVSALTCVLYGG